MTMRTLCCIAGRLGYCICDVCMWKVCRDRGAGRWLTILFSFLVSWVEKMTTENQHVHSSIWGTCVEQDKNALQMHNTLRC